MLSVVTITAFYHLQSIGHPTAAWWCVGFCLFHEVCAAIQWLGEL